MNGIVQFRLCTLTNEELLTAVDQATDAMYQPGGTVPSRYIPARPNEDYDLLVGELIVRLDELDKAVKEVLSSFAIEGDSSIALKKQRESLEALSKLVDAP